jgi:hypothetical protein
VFATKTAKYQDRVEAEALSVPMRLALFRLEATKRGRDIRGTALAGGSIIVSPRLHFVLLKRKARRVTKELLTITSGVSVGRDEKMQAKGMECCQPWAKWFSCSTQLLIMPKSNNDQELVGDVS